MEKKILVLGSEGFIGKSFIKYYINEGNSNCNLHMIDVQDIKKRNYYKCNASNFEKINIIIRKIKPDEIFNFSGSFSNNFENDYINNVIVTKNIFDALILSNNINCKILINGSAAEYGLIKDFDNPVNEEDPLNPISFYGLSKVYQTFLAKTYFLRNDLNVFIARPFNIMGYGVSDKLFVGRLLNEIKKNLKKKSKIVLGNLDSERDYLDIEDLIRAYQKIMNKGKPGEIYNIGSGNAIKIRDLLNIFLDIFGINENEVELNKDFNIKFDIPKIIADISKLKQLNWNKEISLEMSIGKIKQMIIK